MQVRDISNKSVVVAERGMPVDQAARLMRDMHVGSLVIVDGKGAEAQPIGMITDRDLVVSVMAKGLAPASVTVGEIFTARLETVDEEESILDALRAMRSRGIRRLPVTRRGSGSLAGIVTVDDILEVVSEQLSDIVHAIGNEQSREVSNRE